MSEDGGVHVEGTGTPSSADSLPSLILQPASQNDSKDNQRAEKLSSALATVAAMKLDSEPILIEEVSGQRIGLSHLLHPVSGTFDLWHPYREKASVVNLKMQDDLSPERNSLLHDCDLLLSSKLMKMCTRCVPMIACIHPYC